MNGTIIKKFQKESSVEKNLAGPHPIKNLVTSNTILYCRKWDATIRFYRDGLQLPVIFATNWFVEFGLTASSRLSIADEKHAAIKSCGNAGITVALQVRDIDAAREYLEQMDLKPTVIKRHPWDALVFHVFDPEGHRIEMWQSLISDDIRDLNPNPVQTDLRIALNGVW